MNGDNGVLDPYHFDVRERQAAVDKALRDNYFY